MTKTSVQIVLASVTLLPMLAPPVAWADSVTAGGAAPSSYVVDFVATAAVGVDMNDRGNVIGTSYLDNGCGSSCLPPLQTVVWIAGERVVLPTLPGLSGITVTDINNEGWIVGFAGVPGTTTHAVAWLPNSGKYDILDLGNLPGKTISTAAAIDELGRVVGTVIEGRGSLLLSDQTSNICRMARPLTALVDPYRQGPDITPPHTSTRGASLTPWCGGTDTELGDAVRGRCMRIDRLGRRDFDRVV